MDEIYKNAEATIIATGGIDPTFGLAGVSCTRRTPQATAMVRKKVVVSMLPHPKWEIESSKWSTRAWVYQEGLLSRRRLIFTDHQVYYECASMHCCEAGDSPLDILHGTDHWNNGTRKFSQWNRPGIFPANIGGQYRSDIWKRIEEYSCRSLTYDPDVLNALTGIFRV